MPQPKWIRFGNKIIKRRDIDFFELDANNKYISCHHHQGMSYLETYEEFNQDANPINIMRRFSNLQQELGLPPSEAY